MAYTKGLTQKQAKLRQIIVGQRKHIQKLQLAYEQTLNECTHVFRNGDVGGDPVVYCAICNKDVTDIYPGMTHEHAIKLIDNE